ncbi:MAG: SRPBCC family protein [Bacteroidota bacterium]
MKNVIRLTGLFLLILSFSLSVQAQKKVQKIYLSKVIDLPADKVWQIVGEDYGAIAHSHPKIVSSDYISGTLEAGEGAERICHFNKKGTKYLKEKITNYDPENRSFTNTVFKAGKFPVDPEYTRAIYKVEDLGNGQCKISFDMQYRTKPSFMGAMTKGSFKRLIKDYFIAIEHYAKTGEKVTKANFKKIKKNYS